MITVEKKRANRSVAIAVGALYIAATVAGALAVGPVMSLLETPEMLTTVAENESQMLMIVSLEFIMAVTVAGVAFIIYPILKQDADTNGKEGLASWYLGSRITEGALFLVAILARLSLLTLSQEFLKAGTPADSFYKVGGTVLVAASNYSYMLGQSVFCVGAAMLYYLLYQSKRIPRWLSVWGFIAAPLMFIAGFFVLIDGDPNSPISTALYAPMGLQEMVLAIWLIIKGFNTNEK